MGHIRVGKCPWHDIQEPSQGQLMILLYAGKANSEGIVLIDACQLRSVQFFYFIW